VAGVVQLVSTVFWVLQLLVLARVVISWLPNTRYHPISQWIVNVTDPMLRPFRALAPVGAGGLDFSPMILLILLWLARRVVIQLLVSL
jgi:YggT family protein